MNNKTYFSFFVFILLCSCLNTTAAQVDTITVYSPKMDLLVNNVVILPDNYDPLSSNKYPVVYLLHGYGCDHTTWLNTVKPNLPELATRYQYIIVCPDGKNSWYWDSPIDPKSQYDTYVTQELTHSIDSLYSTIKSPLGRAISGFSMGGHGAMWLAIQHPDVFGACGSMSGGVDIRPFPKNWEMSKALGTYDNNKNRWDSYTVMTQVDKLKDRNTAIIIDCGKSDFFLDVNENLHKLLLEKKIPHSYTTLPGEHNPKYWRKSIDNHLSFFSDFFIINNRE